MTDLFYSLPWVRPSPIPSHERPPATGTSPQQSTVPSKQPLSRLLRGANSILALRRPGQGDTPDKPGGSKRDKDGRTTEQQRQILVLRMKNATDNSQWTAAARELDLLEGNDFWKLDDSAPNGEYNPDLISSRLREFDQARINCDIRAMMHLVRTGLTRDLGGMGNIELYRHSYDGTKHLIEQYVESAVRTIDDLVEKSGIPGALPDDIDHKDVLQTVVLARQSFGRTALMLSGGGTWGMMHIGVLKAMFHANLLPRIISGASAGSIVCSVLCTRTNDEIPDVLDKFPYGDLAVFEEQGNEEGVADHLKRLLTEGTWSDIKHLTRVMRGLLGDVTFQEAYNRTRRICNISVSTASIYELPRLLNYITAPNVLIWSAVLASCSVPLIFSAAPLLAKNPHTGEHVPWNPTEQMWMDGSVDNDLPMTRLAEMFNVNHFIVSQVNPHITPFMSKEDRLDPAHDRSRPQVGSALHDPTSWLYTFTTLAKDEALHRLQFMAELRIFPNLVTKLRSVLSQKYSGDINIIPEFTIQDVPRILKNPTVDFMLRTCLAALDLTVPESAHAPKTLPPPHFELGTPSPRLDVLSPTTGAETSDVHTSDGDVDYSHTDESVSDPEPYERDVLYEEVPKDAQ
ncbi:putative patatin-like phospholipase protein [Phaeoacremonium minimum UCRPA7]|uniref:Putative patatin-like phospholipase protein n=1 Tax=Phaeoacremonium minimum (strain UCR-PA7) TaxID=1286976 RepID=R8BSR6_PHAM7|nr:putative patatin-like phospholipase protein [Phaeoacremonium minimum UCRPA7]EOO02381.1 putative patatin-like phospholipase protein [Phaeoacremonium minimum UCRPA7]